MILRAVLLLALLQSAIGNPQSAMAQQLTATTDTNGNFTWPTQIQASQITGFTNSIKIYNTNGLLVGTIGNDGTFAFTNPASGTGFGLASGYVSFNTPFGSTTFSNGDVYGTIAGATPLVNTVTQLQAQATSLQTALLALSNQLVLSLAISNSIYQNEFTASNAALQSALSSTVTVATNTLWLNTLSLIGTNGINGTNFALTLAYQGTNYSYALTTNNGALLTNLVYTVGAGASNNAAALVGNTNYFAAHFRLGTIVMGAGVTGLTNVFSPPFADPNFTVSVAQGDQNISNTYSSFAYSYNTFVVLGPYVSTARTLNYLAYHP